MQLITATTIFLTWTGYALATDDATTCSNKDGAVVNAIGKFCQKTNMVVPSDYGNNGVKSNDGSIWVGISGDCGPAQWVPQQYCFSQLYNMCAEGDVKGQVNRRYGQDGCQYWSIQSLSDGGSTNAYGDY